MRSILLVCLFIVFAFPVVAQSPFQPQLAIPVYLDDIARTVSHVEKRSPDTYLSGIALLFVDTVSTEDAFFVSDKSDFVIWHDNIGQSTKITFIIPDSQFIGRLELLYFQAKCQADLWIQDRRSGMLDHAFGELESNERGYSLRFTSNGQMSPHFSKIFSPLNTQLMELHSRRLRNVAIKSWYNKDSINVIVGADSQFNTDFDLFWLDQSLRQRMRTVASNSFSKLCLFSNPATSMLDSMMNGQRKIVHEVNKEGKGVRGRITITLKPDRSARYVFLKPTHEYQMFVDYSFEQQYSNRGEMHINELGLRDLKTGDFVEMKLLDFVDNGVPILYVDLINGVVTAAEDKWDITNVIHAVEDVIGASVMPEE